ncbi:DUF551 domain-containing protein [Raoultella ornithinolytica]|uniref:DUF551 domain-containing protein n=1 Tax=Raoultella ornithinolytica TaxID=54291 RepID=UPI003A4D9928
MTSKLTITRERLQEIAEDGFLKHGESKILARMALAAMDSEPVAVVEPSDYVTAAQLVGEGPARKAVHELYEGALRIGDKLYRHAQPAPVVLDERAAFNAWNNEDNLPIAGVSAKNAAWLAWQARAELTGNSPAIPDGYVMVPKEPTQAMCAAFNDSDYGRKSLRERYVAMLAAAAHDTPALNSVQSVATVPGKWIPVSERMPDDDDFVYIWPRPDFGVELHVGQYCERSHKGGGWYAQVYEQNYGIEWHPITVTHWTPLPAAPQEVK